MIMHGVCEEDNNSYHKQSQGTSERCVENKLVSLAPSCPVAEQAHTSTVPKMSALFKQLNQLNKKYGWGRAQASSIMPWVVLSQPITALAFTLDGVLYGADSATDATIMQPSFSSPV